MELNYPYLNEEQIKNIKQKLIPKFNEEDINNLKQLEDAEADGLEWLEMFEDYIYPDNLSHILNKKIGLNDDASQEERDEIFFFVFCASSEWTMVTNLVWEWLEENEW